MIELKPCPFCGGEAEMCYSNDNHRRPYVQCKFGSMLTPQCAISHRYAWDYRTEEEAAEAWNRRAGGENE